MKIAFSNDHAGLDQKAHVLEKLRALGHEVIDLGPNDSKSVDYPDTAAPAAQALARGEVDRAVLMCGSGIGMDMVANKFPGVRCALATDLYSAEMSRRHNDANCLALRTREQTPDLNDKIIETWLSTEFEGGRHQPRVDKIDTVSKQNSDKDK